MDIKTRTVFELSNRILELVENQVRNDDNSLTQSDLQGVADVIIMDAYEAGRVAKLGLDKD